MLFLNGPKSPFSGFKLKTKRCMHVYTEKQL